MNWDAIGAIGELFGGLAVVVSFLYLGRQIRQSTKQQRLESHRAMAELQISTNRIFYDSQIARMITKTLNNWSEATFDEHTVTNMWMVDTITHYQAWYEMWKNGAIDDQAWAAEEEYLVKELLATDGGKSFWKESRFLFNRNFIEYLEPRIAKEPMGYFEKNYARLIAEAKNSSDA